MALINGGDKPDHLTGTLFSDTINGNGGDDVLNGGWGDDTLNGGEGNDILDGGVGADHMAGGTGNDTYYVDDAGDVVTENAKEGIDTVYSTVTYTLTANVENLTLQDNGGAINGTGNGLANTIYGNSSANVLTGGGGDDILDGHAGADQMYGGTGNDTYYVDNVFDQVFEQPNEGTDTIYSTVNYTLPNYVENLTLLESPTPYLHATGNGDANTIIGNSGDNVLDGKAGADNLQGGAGNDILIGGSGYNAIDGGAGTDTVDYSAAPSHVGVNLATGIALNGYAGASDTITNVENVVGSAFDDSITGDGNNNFIDGGAGNDTINGGAGDDVIRPGAGNNTIDGGTGSTTVDYSLAPHGVSVDLLPAPYGNSGAADNGYGGQDSLSAIQSVIGTSYADNIEGTFGGALYGEGGDDTLYFGGQMFGGPGNDVYWIAGGESVIELPNQGVDTVYSDEPSYVLPANVENLVLLGSIIANNGTGNDLANVITGGVGDNVIDGKGGADTLSGGVRTNQFVFRAGEANGDTITDFSNNATTHDSLAFYGYGTTGASLTQLDATHWQINSANGLIHDTITLSNSALIHSSDYVFLT